MRVPWDVLWGAVDQAADTAETMRDYDWNELNEATAEVNVVNLFTELSPQEATDDALRASLDGFIGLYQ